MDWKAEAWEELKAYEAKQPEELLGRKQERMQEIRERMTSIRSAAICAPVGSSTKAPRENRLDDLIDEEARLQAEIRAEELRAKVIRRSLAFLSDTERTVLEAFAAMHSEKAVAHLIDVTGYERTQLYRIKDAALQKYILVAFGVIVY